MKQKKIQLIQFIVKKINNYSNLCIFIKSSDIIVNSSGIEMFEIGEFNDNPVSFFAFQISLLKEIK